MKTKNELPECPVATTVSLIGNKWKLFILRSLLAKTCRFNELQREIPGISQKVLTENLRALENDGLIVRTAFLNEHPEAVQIFLEEYAASTQYVNENVEEAAALVEQYIGVAAGVAKKAIPACNIVCMTGEEMKAAAEKYLTVLFELNPDAVGGAMPEESFYYLP